MTIKNLIIKLKDFLYNVYLDYEYAIRCHYHLI